MGHTTAAVVVAAALEDEDSVVLDEVADAAVVWLEYKDSAFVEEGFGDELLSIVVIPEAVLEVEPLSTIVIAEAVLEIELLSIVVVPEVMLKVELLSSVVLLEEVLEDCGTNTASAAYTSLLVLSPAKLAIITHRGGSPYAAGGLMYWTAMHAERSLQASRQAVKVNPS